MSQPEEIREEVSGVTAPYLVGIRVGWVSVAGDTEQAVLLRMNFGDGKSADAFMDKTMAEGLVQAVSMLLVQKQTRN